MNKHIVFILVFLFSVGVNADGVLGNVWVDGKRSDLNSITLQSINNGKLDVRITTSGGNVVSPPVVQPPIVEVPTNPTTCPRTNAQVMPEVKWGVSTNAERTRLSSETKSYPFTTSNKSLKGRFETAYTPSNPRTRSTWISECPGGPPLEQTFRGHPLCTVSSYEVTNLEWSEQPEQRICSLKQNTRYYFNVRNSDSWDSQKSNCDISTNCGFYIRNSTY